MNPVIDSPLLPEGTVHDYASNARSAEECLSQAYETVKGECTAATESYASDSNSESLGDDVHRITSLFSVLTLVNVAPQPRVRVLTPVDDEMAALTELFGKVVLNLDSAGREAFVQQNLHEAKRIFVRLGAAHKHHRGIELDYYIRACIFATDVQSCRQQALLLRHVLHSPLTPNRENLDLLAAIVDHYLGLNREVTPKSLTAWKGRAGGAITDYIKQQENETQEAVKVIWTGINGESKKVGKLLTAEKLQRIQFQTLLNDLRPILSTLERLSGDLDTSLAVHDLLASHCKLLKIENGADHKDVVALMKYWKELTTSAIELLSDLSQARSTEAKNEILIAWIEKHIAAYNCQAEQLSALHSWAFTLLGKLFTSQELSQPALNASIGLLRKYPAALLTHSRALLRDVQLQFGNEGKAMNHLLLGVVSDVLKTSSCTVEKVTEFHSTWKEVPCVGPRIERVRTWLRGDLHITINLLVTAHDDERMLQQRAKATNDVLEALQNNDFVPLEKLSNEEVVALFEVAHFLLQMPPEIITLSIHHLDTARLRVSLNALLSLRFSQARKVNLPYGRLQSLFEPLDKDEFLKWISLYNPERINKNELEHHMLFTAVAVTVDRLLKSKVLLSDEEIEKISRFVAERYSELRKSETNPDVKIALNTEFVRLICLALTKAQNVVPYHELEPLDQVDSLRTNELEAVKATFTPQVISWLEQRIYPRILRLELTRGLDTHGLGNFTLCTQLTALAMPLPQAQSHEKLQAFARVALGINTLQLCSGELDPQIFDSFPELTHLSLQDITNLLDFSRCQHLRTRAISLDFRNVLIVENSLSWVASCEQLASLSIRPCENGTIGSLADDVVVHADHAFTTLVLDLTDFDRDRLLVASLPKLLDTFQTLSHVTLRGHYSQSLLEALLLDRRQDSQLATLKFTWNEADDPSVLSNFERLGMLHCYTSNTDQVERMKAFTFNRRPQLVEWKAISPDGLVSVRIPIKVADADAFQ